MMRNCVNGTTRFCLRVRRAFPYVFSGAIDATTSTTAGAPHQAACLRRSRALPSAA